MSVTVAQRPMGKEFDGSGGRIGYIAFCESGDDEADVVSAVEADAPTTYLGFARGKPRAIEINIGDDGEPSTWDVEVPYGVIRASLTPPATGTTVWSVTTAGGTQHITSGIASGTAYADPGVSTIPADWGGVIGATKDGIEGVDITVPQYSVRATKYVAAGSIAALKAAAFALTGTVNSDSVTYDGDAFAAGELLFLGMTATKRTEVSPADYECTFEFAASPNATGITVGAITGIDKEGWDYLDVTFEDRESDGFMYKVPIIATVHQVYEREAFAALGL